MVNTVAWTSEVLFPGKVGDNCTTASDCVDAVGNSSCVSGQCACLRRYLMDRNGALCRRRFIGDKCVENEDCLHWLTKTECRQHTCHCHRGMMGISEGRACKIRKIGDPCVENSDCSHAVEHSKCHRGGCSCQYNYIQNKAGVVCWKSYKIEEIVAVTFSAIGVVIFGSILIGFVVYFCAKVILGKSILWWQCKSMMRIVVGIAFGI